MIVASTRSTTTCRCSLFDLPRNSNTIALPFTVTWRLDSVEMPKVWFSRA